MAKIQKNFVAGRMNKSIDERLVPQGEYIDALNVRLGSTEGTEVGAVENSKGNTEVVSLNFKGNPLSSEAKCIGAYEDGANETIYWFVNDKANSLSSTGKVDLVVSFNTRTFVLFYHLISTSVLNFDSDFLMNGIDLIGDLLFFTDNLNAPRKINVKRTYLQPNSVTTVDELTEQDIGVILAPPLNSPKIEQYQLGGGENYMEELLLSFAYRWQYEDGEYSALSPFSQVAFTPGPFQINYQTYDNDAMLNLYNTTDITFNTGGRNVLDVDVIFKFSTSQSVNVIERFNKVNEGWLDGIEQTLSFTNKKIFTTLPEEQLLRLFDNVPRKAQAQTIMGNRLMYGNYIDGYNIENSQGKDIYLDYNLSLITESLSAEEIDGVQSVAEYSINGNVNVVNGKVSIDFGGLDLVDGSQIGVEFEFENSQFSGDPSYADGTEPENSFTRTFLFNIQQDYASVYALAISPEFQNAVSDFVAINDSSCFTFCTANCTSGTSLTDLFNCGITSKNEWVTVGFGITASPQGILVEATQGSDVIGFTLPAIKFEQYDQTQTPPTPLGVFAYEYLTSIDATGLYAKDSSKQTLHSNRDYEIAVVYMDDYGRSTTALVDTENTVYIPCQNSITKNNIRVEVNNYPPYWATKYKFVIKESKGLYRTIYSNIFFQEEETGVTYFKLEGDNRDKVKDNTILYVKSDTNGPVLNCSKTKVLGFGVEIDDFLCDKDANGTVIEGTCGQFGGTYMQLKPTGFAADYPPNAFVERKGKCKGSYCVATAGTNIENPDFGDPGELEYEPFSIPAGSLVRIKLRANRNKRGSKCGSRTYEFDKRFTAGNDYDSLYDFIQGDNVDLTNGVTTGSDDTINVVSFDSQLYAYPVNSNPFFGPITAPGGAGQNVIFFQEDAVTGKQYLSFRNGTPTCSSPDKRNSWGNVLIEAQRATSLMVFETEPLDANDELYYENEQTFDIVDGFHLSGDLDADQDQTLLQPAIVDLTFFNAFTFGNGVESDTVLDALIKPVLELGEKVTSVSEEQYKESNRFADVTYSGVFNQETNLNKLNQFNLALANFKTLETAYGPVRVMHSRQTDILVLQEDRISSLLVGKNLLSDAAAGGAITSVPEVLGTQLARVEEFGISNNPESFSTYGTDVFFTDAKRSSVLQLKGSGAKGDTGGRLGVISEVGMRSWFRDLFVDSFETQKLGGFDPYMNEFVLSSNDILIPQPIDIRECGYSLILSQLLTPYNLEIDLTTIIGNVVFDYEITGSVNIKIEWDGNVVVNQSVTGNGSVNFTKTTNNPTNAIVILTPDLSEGVPSVEMDFNCPQAALITVKEIVINFAGEASETTTCRYRWSLGTDLSPYSTNSVTLEDDGISLFTGQTGQSSFGTLPALGSLVTMKNRQGAGQTFQFDPTSDKFKYLVTNTNYNEADISTLIPLLNTATPIVGSFPEYSASFTYNSQSDYIYLVWDLREPTLLQMCYDVASPSEACCNCTEPPQP
jgi:hypothetical protein